MLATQIRIPRLILLASLSLALGASLSACAQRNPGGSYEPQPFQPGKDVVWVPTPQVLVDRMLDLAKVTKDDFVMDLGSGDGRTVITAAKRGARALGVEYDPDLVAISKRNAEKEGVEGRAAFIEADLFKTDFSQATVITMFLLPELNLRLRPRILALKPGTRIASNTFTMGDWLPDETAKLTSNEGCSSAYCTALFWIVPARVEGVHKLPQGEFSLTQVHQVVSGTLRAEGKSIAVEGKVRGEEVVLHAGGREFRGRINGKSLELR